MATVHPRTCFAPGTLVIGRPRPLIEIEAYERQPAPVLGIVVWWDGEDEPVFSSVLVLFSNATIIEMRLIELNNVDTDEIVK